MAVRKLGALGKVENLISNASFSNNSTDCYIMTEDNILMFCANLIITGNYNAGTVIFKLPTAVTPRVTNVVPVAIRNDTNNTYTLERLNFNNNGNVAIPKTYSGGCTVFLSSICVSVNSRYFNSPYITGQGSSPL